MVIYKPSICMFINKKRKKNLRHVFCSLSSTSNIKFMMGHSNAKPRLTQKFACIHSDMLQLLGSYSLVVITLFLWCNLTVLPLGPFQRTGFNEAVEVNAPCEVHRGDADIRHSLLVSLEGGGLQWCPPANTKKDHAFSDTFWGHIWASWQAHLEHLHTHCRCSWAWNPLQRHPVFHQGVCCQQQSICC